MSRPLGTCLIALVTWTGTVSAQHASTANFTFEQVRSYPFPTELTTAATGARLAWAFNEQGERNLYVAAGPEFAARRLTRY
ncbi:MAG: hypothetical protein AMS18_10155, partial [Gemmatimonas sp. SG8_17]